MARYFSIIMRSYLGTYQGAAGRRESKLVRAIDSVIMQTFSDWELVVVADGCERTLEIIEANYPEEKRIRTKLIPKQPLWAPETVNAGIREAEGKWILYLDTDDYFGSDHLKKVHQGLQSSRTDWAWFNDLTWNRMHKAFVERICDLSHKDKHGTSNLVHARSLGLYWPEGGYKQDAHFANELKSSGTGIKIPTPEYCVAHIPNAYEV